MEAAVTLRHTIATLAYRGAKAMRGAPEEFAAFRPAEGSRTAGEIQAHISDLLDWALAQCDGRQDWHDSVPSGWTAGVERFHRALEVLDRRLGSGEPVAAPDRLFQGAIADAFTHVGQIAMMRRLAGCPIKGENYHKAEIASGRVGSNQAAAVYEFH